MAKAFNQVRYKESTKMKTKKDKLDLIKKAWKHWESLKIPEYHCAGCPVTIGSRADPWECDCGLHEAISKKNAAFEALRLLVLRRT